jgi:hypothetical protein
MPPLALLQPPLAAAPALRRPLTHPPTHPPAHLARPPPPAEIFKAGVMGACWSPDGHNLFLASYDGTLACARFQPEELGRQLSEGDMRELLRALYGDISSRCGGVEVWVCGEEAGRPAGRPAGCSCPVAAADQPVAPPPPCRRSRVLAESAEQLLLEAAGPAPAPAAPSGQDPFSRLNSRVMPTGATSTIGLQVRAARPARLPGQLQRCAPGCRAGGTCRPLLEVEHARRLPLPRSLPSQARTACGASRRSR